MTVTGSRVPVSWSVLTSAICSSLSGIVFPLDAIAIHIHSDELPQPNTMAGSRAGNKPATNGSGGGSGKQSLTEAFDKDLYDGNGGDKYAGYNTSIATTQDVDMEDAGEINGRRLVGQYTASADILNEYAHGEDDLLESREKQAQIASRETDYQRRRFDRKLSPDRADAFAKDGQDGGQSYQEVMLMREIEREEARVQQLLEQREKNGNAVLDHKPTLKDGASKQDGSKTPPVEKKPRKRRRWDDDGADATPMEIDGAASETTVKKRSRWSPEEQTPKALVVAEPTVAGSITAEPAAAEPVRSRWDTAAVASTPRPAPNNARTASTNFTFGTDISGRNAPLSDEQLDMMLPAVGYKILDPPPGYEPARRPVGVPTLPTGYQGYLVPEADNSLAMMGKQLPTEIPGVGDLQFFKSEDMKYFGKLTDGADENEMTIEELKERKIMRLLLKVKNGTPPMRKTALRQLTDNARQFGPAALFNQLLPLLMERTLEDQERHLLVKVIDRVLYKLDDLVRPYVHKILVVIEPLLIDQDCKSSSLRSHWRGTNYDQIMLALRDERSSAT